MFLDALGYFSDGQTFTTDDYCTKSVDLADLTLHRRIGTGEPLCIVINVETAESGGGECEFQAIQSANANLTSYTVMASCPKVSAALTAGSIHVIPIPPGLPTERYIGLYFNNTSGSTSVVVSAYLVPMSFVQANLSYPKGYTIS